MRKLQHEFLTIAVWWGIALPASAITVHLDYTYDTTNFFGPGNPQGAVAGAQARAAVETAAAYFSDILNDSFSAIQAPPQFVGANGGMVSWKWTINFDHPSNSSIITLTDPSVLADQYLVFVGAENLASVSTPGAGGPGGYSWSAQPTGFFTAAEIGHIQEINDDFANAVEHRGETSGFSRWGGLVAFDSVPNSPWHYNSMTPVPANAIDFYSVALHELAHALGFGSSDTWSGLVSGTNFIGPNAVVEHGGVVPLESLGAHWAPGTASTVFGGSSSQLAAMTPTSTSGLRRHFTALDAAAMRDIGWEVVPPTPVPEPATAVLVVATCVAPAAAARKSRIEKRLDRATASYCRVSSP